MTDNTQKIVATLADMAKAVTALAEATQQMAAAIEEMNRPKAIVRGEDGRATGVETIRAAGKVS